MDTRERLLAAAAISNPLDHAEHEASPSDLTIPSFVSFFHAAAREPDPSSPPTTVLYSDPPTKAAGSRPKWIQIRMLNISWSKVQRIYFYILRAVGAFLRLRRLGNSPRTPLGIDFTKHFVTKCSHANTDGIPSVHAFCSARLYTASDINIAASVAIWQAQKAHPPSKDLRKQLQLVEFHGLLYVKGRLDRSSLASTTKTPLYLPRKSALTDLIIYDYHRANLHAGIATTLANVRIRYWFDHGRRTVTNAIKRRCFECRKMTNPAYSIPPWPSLPTTRTEISRPFRSVGIDFYGPVMLKPMTLDGIPSKELRKYYVCLFTCLSVRAIHCELVNDLSTAQFFHAFKRFAARRSYPSEVLTDNGTTFLAARQTIASMSRVRQRTHADLSPVNKSSADPAAASFALRSRTRKGALRSSKRAAAGIPAAVGNSPSRPLQGNSLASELAASDENLDASDELFSFFSFNNITWRTITERAAWKGGVYERMIGLVKSCLSKTLGRIRPSVDNYLTLLAQAEWVVNCRPISYVNNSERDFTLVRPIDLLIPTLQGQQPLDFMDPEEDANSKEDPDYTPAIAEDKFQRRLLKDLELARRLSDQFGKLWREGYLLELTRQFGKKPTQTSYLPAVGDIVLIYDENLPRAYWRYGLVMELHPSSDGVVREASVRLSETLRDTRRAVNHLFPLKPMLQEQESAARPPSHVVPISAEPVSVHMAHVFLSEMSDQQDKPQQSASPTDDYQPSTGSPAEVVPTLTRPPPSDAQKNSSGRSRSRSKGRKDPSGIPHGSEARGTPRVSKGPRTPNGSPPKPLYSNIDDMDYVSDNEQYIQPSRPSRRKQWTGPQPTAAEQQIVSDRPQRTASQEARVIEQYGKRNPKNVSKQLRGRMLLNNDDWPEDGNCTNSSAIAEEQSARPRTPDQSQTTSMDSSPSPQPKVRSQIVVRYPQRSKSPAVRSQIVKPTPRETPKSPATKRHAVSVPAKGRTDFIPASVALRRPKPKPLLKLRRQAQSHKLVKKYHKGKPRGIPRGEPMDTDETATTSKSQTSTTQSDATQKTTSKRRSKQAGAIATASSSSSNTRSSNSAVQRTPWMIGGYTPATSKQFRDTGMEKILKIGTKKRIVDPPAQVIPFVDTHVRKDMLTCYARNTPLNREFPVTFAWHAEVPPEYAFAFGIAHFSHPASQVPLTFLPVIPTDHVPTIEECLADQITYDNGYLRGALYGCYPHLTFFANVGVRHYIKQHIFQNRDFRPVGILTGLDYSQPPMENPWQSTEEMILTQRAAFTDFVNYAIELADLKVHRPLCLVFGKNKKTPRNSIDEGLQLLRTLQLPREYPIYLVTWEGNPSQAWEWVRHYPRTTFGFTVDYVLRRTDPASIQFKREIPLHHVFLESVTPAVKGGDDRSLRTTGDVLLLAELMQSQVGENHKHILASTALAAFNFFFPQEIAPANWHCPPSTQTVARWPTVQAKIASLVAAQAAAVAAADASVAPGGPSAHKQKGRKPQSTKSLEAAWTKLEEGAFADFIKDKMDEFSPHYTTTQEQQIWQERREFIATTKLNVTVVNTEFRGDLSNQRVVTGASTSAATSSQSSAAAVAAAALGTAPAPPDHAAGAAAQEEVLPLDREPWNIRDVNLPSTAQPPVNDRLYGFNSPQTKEDGDQLYTGFEPLVACPGHGRMAQHMSLDLAVKDYKRLCRNVPANRRVDGQLPIHSFGEMFCIVWAQRFTPLPKADGIPSTSSGSNSQAEAQRQPNFSVHDFMGAILRNEPSAIPQTMNRYFAQVTRGTDAPLFTPGEIGSAILRWYESCPTAANYLRNHLTGPIRYYPDFLEGCDPQIANAFMAVWPAGFRQGLDYVRLRIYMVNVRRHRMWTTPQETRNLKKTEIRRIEVDESKILTHRQIVFADKWGDRFMTPDLRPDVHVRQLSGLATEAVDVARDFYLGHSVERVYIFWGCEELRYGPGHTSDHLFKLSRHFSHEFPFVRCFLILPPYLQVQHARYRETVQRILRAQEGSFANVTLVWFPTDEQLSDYFEAALRQGQRLAWPTRLQSPDGIPSDEGRELRKDFWEERYDVTLWVGDQYDREQERQRAAAELEADNGSKQPPQPGAQSNQEPPNAGDDSSAMDHEPSKQGPHDTEGIPPVSDIPLPDQEQPRTRASTAESSGVEIIERDVSPGVLSNFSVSPAPGPSTDVVPLFQHLLTIKNIQPGLQPQINEHTLAVLFPQAGPEQLSKLWSDYQKSPLTFYAIDPSGAEAAGTAIAVPQPKPSEAQFDATDEDAEHDGKDTRQRLHELLYADESLSQSDISSPEYTPLPDDYVPHPDEVSDEQLSEHDEPQGVSPPEADGNSPQPMDTEVTSTTETRNSEAPTTADDSTGGTTGPTTSSISDPWTHDGPANSDDW